MNDLVFDYGWRKKMMMTFQNKEEEVELVFSAYKGQEVLDVQKSVFEKFTSNYQRYEQKVLALLQEYAIKHSIKEPKVVVKTVLIQRNGALGLLCDCSWDEEHGIAFVLEPECYITIQDDFL